MAAKALPGVPLWVTENGAAVAEEVGAESVSDPARVDYFRRHLRAVLDARAEGLDVRGYYAWSLLDNYEWSLGYSKRFGLIHVDYSTQQRTIKSSGRFYSSVIASRGEVLAR